jgi:hypothetical protein
LELEELKRQLEAKRNAGEKKEEPIILEPVREEPPRRTFFKKYAWPAAITISALSVGGVVGYLSSLQKQSEQTQQQIQSQTTFQQSQQQTQQQSTQQLPQSTDYPQDAFEDWPIRRNMQELKNAQAQIGSLSSYILPEFDDLPADDYLKYRQDGTMVDVSLQNLERAYLKKYPNGNFWPNRLDFADAKGMFYFDRSVGIADGVAIYGAVWTLISYSDPNNLSKSGTGYSNEGTYPEILLNALDPRDDPSDKVQFRAKNNAYRKNITA